MKEDLLKTKERLMGCERAMQVRDTEITNTKQEMERLNKELRYYETKASQKDESKATHKKLP